MEKISKDRAISLIEKGFWPKCEVSRDVFRVIHSLDELKYYESLAIAQEFTLYGCTDKEIENFRVLEDAIEMTLDDAFKMLHDPDTIIYARILGEGEVKLSKLSELSFFLRKYNGENIPFLFYWRG